MVFIKLHPGSWYLLTGPCSWFLVFGSVSVILGSWSLVLGSWFLISCKRPLTFHFPQTGLALMGFSRYCPSSLDLPNFVVREPPRSHRGATAEECSSRSKSAQAWPRPGQASIWELGNLGTWKSRNLGSKKSKKYNSQNKNPFCPKCRQGLD